ncbi:MAG: outer membrane beta-barrel protein [Deltaproteobacteria bacterium]|nr:outer membrane beta-barrel protein [Deltaproteobacteria bacterium]
MKKLLLLLLAVLFLSSSAAPAGAAGWYMRGGLGFEWSLAGDFSDRESTAQNPPALFGTGPGRDGRQIGAYGDFGRFPSIEAAAGKQLLPWLRTEFAVHYRPDMQYRGQANFRGVPGDQPVSARADALTGMVNLFCDVAPLFGLNSGRFQPYLGGGIGASYNQLGDVTYLFPGNPGAHKVTITPGGNKTDIAWMAGIGMGIALSERTVLDLSYRYADLGRVSADAGRASANNVPAGFDVDQTWAPLRFQGVFAGIRYLFN